MNYHDLTSEEKQMHIFDSFPAEIRSFLANAKVGLTVGTAQEALYKNKGNISKALKALRRREADLIATYRAAYAQGGHVSLVTREQIETARFDDILS